MAETNETVQVPHEGEQAVAEPAGKAAQPARDGRPRRRSSGLLLAIAVLILIAAVIATAFTLLANRRISIADMRTLLELMLGPLFALAGAALGFYYANR
jgi:hypothetical protein